MCYIDTMPGRLNIVGIEDEELEYFRLLSLYSGLPYGRCLAFLIRSWKNAHPDEWISVVEREEKFKVKA